MKVIFIDIDNTLLSFDAYVKHTMKEGFETFGLKPYESWMFETFTKVNNGLWQQIEQGTLTFQELEKIRWNRVFEALRIAFDGVVFEKYFREALYESAIPEEGAYELLEHLHGKYLLCAASNGPYQQQVHRLEIADMKKYFTHLFVSEKIGISKPATEFFDRAFQIVNEGEKEPVLPEECMMIGDSLTSDIEGGQMYGMKTCFYRRGKEVEVGTEVLVADTLEEVWECICEAEKE